MNAFTVCVDYHDIFRQVAPLMRHHFDRWFVMTSPRFLRETKKAVEGLDIWVHDTEAFYAGGAVFNKWLGLEQLLSIGGRFGWICIIDADIVWPEYAPLDLVKGKLYTPCRYMYPEVNRIPPEGEWSLYPTHREVGEFAGYTQIFHANDPVLGTPPWHETDWKHAGGADSFFQRKWARGDKIRPSWRCLHVGPCGMNWCGRATAYADGSAPTDSDRKVSMLRNYIRQRKGGDFRHEKLGGV